MADVRETSAPAFSQEQQDYLRGYAAGLAALGALPHVGHAADGRLSHDPALAPANLAAPAAGETWHGVPVDELCREEQLKREENPLDIWDKMLRHAAADKAPEGGDVYRFKFHGLFYVAPAQDSFMVRVRVPGNVLTAAQLRALGALARDLGGGAGDITTRGNVQVRQIRPRDTVATLMRLADAGLSARGAGADNVRNVTATPTAGLDPEELYDVRPLARGLQFYLDHHRDLFGLPRKFNVSFDSGGAPSVVSDTNDIAFLATRLERAVDGCEPGVYFRVQLAGITGHGRFAQDSGLLLRAEETVAVAAAIIRAFAETGDRTDRKKARLCYVLDRLGVEGFLEVVQRKLAFPLRRVALAACAPRRPVDRHAHLGVHRQRQPGLSYVGVAIPVGRMTAKQMTQLATLAEAYGSGELRLTVWQNLLIPDVPDGQVERLARELARIGFSHRASSAFGGLVACTGNAGCRFAMSDTKGHALALGRYLEKHAPLDQPLNIHLTGCPHSCAQHYVGDIGLLGVKVPADPGPVEGYHVYVGGGCDDRQGLARELYRSVPFEALKPLLARLLRAYAAHRHDGEAFAAFTRRHDAPTLAALVEATA